MYVIGGLQVICSSKEGSLVGLAPSQEKKGLVSCLYATSSSGYVISAIYSAITHT